MNNFYSFAKGNEKPKFYKKLTDLCKLNDLNYSNIYHQMGSGRNNLDEYQGDGFKIERLSFAPLIHPQVAEQLANLKGNGV